ncbi:MAG: 5-(carboxyamino)imidazole ribonucleotide mutase [Candidatus Eisenbacteria bacterium]|nr:5-(carboxyamino)imidazole ribonucleotide mutase [Candidatus Latescibacterota bacterium]MBD3301112.1 5-(carboxyamino)imidazole ribonucleotide mutase [Candidatus Eisenbacteria bacterium]
MNERASGDPRVGILFGSESDREVMSEAGKVLERFGVAHEMQAISAHRTPDAVRDYARQARDRGIRVLICGAGMAAHLAGAVAANTTLPVLGVPLPGGTLDGLDALLSTVQMPAGVPVATLAVGKAGARNAAVLALQILALGDEAVARRVDELKEAMARGERL